MSHKSGTFLRKNATKTGFICAAIMILGLCTSASAVEYTLEDLYRIALERSERIKISEEDLFISQKEKDRAMSALFPRLSGVGSATSNKNIVTSDTNVLIQPAQSSYWSVRLDQSLSTAGREITAFQVSRDSIDKSRQDLFSARETYILNVTGAYYDTLKARKFVEISQQNVDRLQKYREAAQTRLTIGEVTKTALLRAEAELSGAQSDLIRAVNLLKSAKTVLQRTVGIEEDFDIYDVYKSGFSELSSVREESREPVVVDCASLSLDCLKDLASKERAEVKSLTIQKNIATEQVRFARGADWPTLSLEGAYIYNYQTPETPNLIRENFYGAVRLNFPFFEGGLRRAEIQEALARERQAQYALIDLKKTIAVDVENAYLDYITQKGILKSLGDQYAFASDNYNAVSKQFDFGLAQSIDVMDANTVLVTAQTQLIQALYNYQQSITKLKRVTGTLLKSIAGEYAKQNTAQ
ncbi:MAG TPA: TolC family protein [Syntrophorhabdaceae bacterium]|nr:TolC family protein [Syntrophorhabdaceae bacterium]